MSDGARGCFEHGTSNVKPHSQRFSGDEQRTKAPGSESFVRNSKHIMEHAGDENIDQVVDIHFKL